MVEMFKFSADHSLDDKTTSVAANFRETTSNFSLQSYPVCVKTGSKYIVNITGNSLCVCGFALFSS